MSDKLVEAYRKMQEEVKEENLSEEALEEKKKMKKEADEMDDDEDEKETDDVNTDSDDDEDEDDEVKVNEKSKKTVKEGADDAPLNGYKDELAGKKGNVDSAQDKEAPKAKKRKGDKDVKDEPAGKVTEKDIKENSNKERIEALIAEMSDEELATAVHKLEESIEMSEELAGLFEEAGFDENFRKKAGTLFEAAVYDKVSKEKAKLEESYQENLEEATKELEETMAEKINGYASTIVESWLEENKLAVESQLKSELAESFFVDLHQLLENHGMLIAENTDFNAVEKALKRADELEEKVNKTINENVDLKKELNDLKKERILENLSVNLTETDKEKLNTLVESVSTDDLEEYEEKVSTIKEGYFNKARPSKNDEDGLLIETTDEDNNDQVKEIDPYVNSVVKALERSRK